MARKWGSIETDRRPSGKVRHRINLGRVEVRGEKRLRRFEHGPAPSFLPFASRADAELELERCRARALANGESKADVVESFLPELVRRELFETWAARYEEHFVRLCEAGERSWNTLRDIRRWTHPGDDTHAQGYWRWWDGRDLRELTNADGTAWTTWLADQPSRSRGAAEDEKVGAKTRRNVIDGFRSFLRWAATEAHTGAGMAWTIPVLKSPRYERGVTETISPEETRAVIDAIPWGKRGAYLAQAYETVRFGTMAATMIDDVDAESLELVWQRGRQGNTIDAPVGGQKNRRIVKRQPWDEELIKWLRWRLDQVRPEDRLQRRRRSLFWNPDAARHVNPDLKWSEKAFRATWWAAAKKVGVNVPPQAGTRHSTLSRLGELLTPHALRELSMHRDLSSLTPYTTGTRADRDAIVRAIGSGKEPSS